MTARRTWLLGVRIVAIAGVLLVGAVMLLMVLGGPQPALAQVQLAPPPSGLARVWFVRQYQPSESLATPWIYVNGAPVTTSQPGTIFYRDFPPGTYTFTVETCGQDVNQFPTVQLTPNTQVEFEVQSLQSLTPPDCPPREGTFYVRPVEPRFLQLYLPQLAYLGPR